MSDLCKESFMNGWHEQRCSRSAWRDGYCKQHHPETKKAREEEKQRKWEEKKKREPWYLLKEANAKIARLEEEIADLRRKLTA